ncbi:hypothetical protein BGX27_009948 [Mortierella sp. AM989]|nr:hypothetical protein BGX27_009948 [Mortierella sp. AM989]
MPTQLSINPLALPELALAVSQHLDLIDIVQCALVCRSWNVNFTPLVWANVLVTDLDTAILQSAEINPAVTTESAEQPIPVLIPNASSTVPNEIATITTVETTAETTAETTVESTVESTVETTPVETMANSTIEGASTTTPPPAGNHVTGMTRILAMAAERAASRTRIVASATRSATLNMLASAKETGTSMAGTSMAGTKAVARATVAPVATTSATGGSSSTTMIAVSAASETTATTTTSASIATTNATGATATTTAPTTTAIATPTSPTTTTTLTTAATPTTTATSTTTANGKTAPTAPVTQKQKHPSVAAIIKNAQHIRVLNYSGRLPVEYLVQVQFPQLRRLKIVELTIPTNTIGNDNKGNTATSIPISTKSLSRISGGSQEHLPATNIEIEVDTLKVIEASESSTSHVNSGAMADVEAQGCSKIDAWIIHLLKASPLLEVMIVEEMADNIQVLRAVRDTSNLRMVIWGNIIDDNSWSVFQQPKQRAAGRGPGRLEHICAYGWDKDAKIHAVLKNNTFKMIKNLKLYCLTGKKTELLYQMRLVKMCVQQESLCWYLTKDSNHGVEIPTGSFSVEPSIFLSKDFDEMCEPDNWQTRLRKIDLDLPGLGDQELTRILVSLTAGTLEYLSVSSTHSFGPNSLEALRTRDQFSKLQHIKLEDMSFGVQFSNQVALKILSSCPKLVYFSGSSIMAKSLLHNEEPWVCRDLRELRIHVSFATTNSEGHLTTLEEEWRCTLNHIVFKHLAKLTALETMEICTVEERNGQSPPADSSSCSLDWRIKSGMDHLEGLTQLRRIRVGAGQEMDKADVAWILEHWPNLEKVAGRLHQDELHVATFTTLFAERGVSLECE